jgi:hypothetical protein
VGMELLVFPSKTMLFGDGLAGLSVPVDRFMD